MLKFQKGDYRECVNKTFRMPVEIVKQLEELSQKNHTSPTKILIQCVEYALAHVEEETAKKHRLVLLCSSRFRDGSSSIPLFYLFSCQL